MLIKIEWKDNFVKTYNQEKRATPWKFHSNRQKINMVKLPG